MQVDERRARHVARATGAQLEHKKRVALVMYEMHAVGEVERDLRVVAGHVRLATDHHIAVTSCLLDV